MRTLQITSPLMRGKDVRQAQSKLKTNVFKQNFMQGFLIDGQFGPDTGRACIRAKYWLGYRHVDQDPTFGTVLMNFLTGETPLPEKQKAVRGARLTAAKEKPLREKAFAEAVKDLGQTEHPPNSNRCAISNAWGIQGPWCAMATSTWYLRAGSKAFRDHVDWAYCPYMLSVAISGDRGLAIVKAANVKRGDIVLFDWEQNGVSDHVELFDRWTAKGKTFATIGGNTSPTNWSNGGQVARMNRTVGQVARSRGRVGFVHVGR